MEEAVRKVDYEVTKIRKWDRQGSTVAVVYINESQREEGNEGLLKDASEADLNNEVESENDENDANSPKHTIFLSVLSCAAGLARFHTSPER